MTCRLAVIVSHPIPYFASCYRELQAQGGVDLRVLFCCDWGIQQYEDPQFGVQVQWNVPLLDGYPHEFLPIARRPRRLGFWEVDNREVGVALDGFDPHVILVHGYARRTNWRAAAWARRRGVPVMIYSDSNTLARAPLWKQPLKRALVGRFYSLVDGALYVSASNRAYHRRYGLPEDRLFPGVIPAEVDRLLRGVPDRMIAKREIRRRWNIPDEAFVVIQSGKYVAHKQPLDLLRAVHGLYRKGLSIWALLVGDGAERAAMQAFLQACQCRNVVLTGFVNQAEIGRYYSAADAVALVSSHEPLGLGLIEGMAFGLPAIASDQVGCVGPADAARPGVNAVVFPSGDVQALEAAIARLCTERETLRRMGEASVRLADRWTPRAAAGMLSAAACRLRAMGPRTDQRRRPLGFR